MMASLLVRPRAASALMKPTAGAPGVMKTSRMSGLALAIRSAKGEKSTVLSGMRSLPTMAPPRAGNFATKASSTIWPGA
jgi:hypothetical protein